MNRINQKKHTSFLVTHIQNNLRQYTITCIIFLIGLLFGVIFVNNLNNIQTNEINTYINNSITSIKENENINKLLMLTESIKSNLLLVIFLWLMGSTIIGLLFVYMVVGFKGFCLGYTMSSLIYVLGTGKGIIFFMTTMFLKNIIVIPCTLALAVSGMKLYRTILQDRRKGNIKLEVTRHTLSSAFIFVVLTIASFIEVYVSCGFLGYYIKYM